MSTLINTISRFSISTFFILSGLSRIIHPEQTISTLEGIGLTIPYVLFSIIVFLEISGGILLFLGYKVEWATSVLIIGMIITTFIFQDTGLALFKHAALIAGLTLLVNNQSGETFLEFVATDIDDLPLYKTRL